MEMGKGENQKASLRLEGENVATGAWGKRDIFTATRLNQIKVVSKDEAWVILADWATSP